MTIKLPKKMARQQGFTLIELLVVIVIIAILATIVFVALDPVTRFAEARNSRRWNDINNLLTSVHEYIVDNRGAMPTELNETMTPSQLGTAGSGCAIAGCGVTNAACRDLSTSLAPYLKSIPIDPQGTAATTAYAIDVNSYSIVTITACNAEEGETIEVSR